MSWVCGECGRAYDDPPPSCPACRGEVVPAGSPATDRFSLAAARDRLLDPGAADTSLVDVDPRIAIAFRILVGVTILLLVGAVVLVVLG